MFHLFFPLPLLIWKISERGRVKPEWRSSTVLWHNQRSLIQSIGSAPKYSHPFVFQLLLLPFFGPQVSSVYMLFLKKTHSTFLSPNTGHSLKFSFLFLMSWAVLSSLTTSATPVYSEEWVNGKFGVKYFEDEDLH